MILMQKWLRWLCFLVFILFTQVNAGLKPIELETFTTHSRLIIDLDESQEVQSTFSQKGFSLLFKKSQFIDWGIQSSEESEFQLKMSQVSDLRVHQIKVVQEQQGLRIIVEWRYPEGELALLNPEMEHFSYYQFFEDSLKNKYVIDFWLKKSQTLIESENKKHQDKSRLHFEKLAKEAAADLEKKSKKESKDALYLDPFSNFCNRPLNDTDDIFLEFYPFHQTIDFYRWFPATTADENFEYYLPKSDSKKDQYIRLIVNLYQKGKIALAMRSLEFLNEEFPQHNSQEEMNFLKANALIRLDFLDQGVSSLVDFTQQFKKSKISEYSASFLAAYYMNRNQFQLALGQFLFLIQYHYDSLNNWIFHLGAAECFYYLKQFNRALKEYEWVIEKSKIDDSQRAEASYRLGDIFLEQKQYEQSVAAYYYPKKFFLKEHLKYPAYFLNQAEAYYQLKKFNESRSIYEFFLEKFPNHPEGWRATFRLGEIEERLASDLSGRMLARRWYYDSINRYPNHLSLVLSRIRLLPCASDHEFLETAQNRFFLKEASSFNGENKVRTEKFEDFKILAHIRTIIKFREKRNVLDEIIYELNLAKESKLKSILERALYNFFTNKIIELIREGKDYEAIKLYDEKSKKVKFSGNSLNYKYLIDLSKISLKYGLVAFAEKLLEEYTSVSSSNESEVSFLKAKILFLLEKNNNNIKNFNKIIENLKKIPSNSEYNCEKELILYFLNEKFNKMYSSIVHLTKANMILNHPSLDIKILKMQIDLKKYNTALLMIKNVKKKIKEKKYFLNIDYSILENFGFPGSVSLEEVLILEEEILKKNNKNSSIKNVYLDSIKSGNQSDRVIFNYVKNLINKKNINQSINKSLFRNLKKVNIEKEKSLWNQLSEQEILIREKKEQLLE